MARNNRHSRQKEARIHFLMLPSYEVGAVGHLSTYSFPFFVQDLVKTTRIVHINIYQLTASHFLSKI